MLIRSGPHAKAIALMLAIAGIAGGARYVSAEQSPPSVWQRTVILRDEDGNVLQAACESNACFHDCCWDDPG